MTIDILEKKLQEYNSLCFNSQRHLISESAFCAKSTIILSEIMTEYLTVRNAESNETEFNTERFSKFLDKTIEHQTSLDTLLREFYL